MFRQASWLPAICLLLLVRPAIAQTSNWTAGTGNYFVATNWDNGIPNGATAVANVTTTNGGTAYTVTFNGTASVSALNISATQATFQTTGGTLSATTANITAGTFVFNGGTVQGGNYTAGSGSGGFVAHNQTTVSGVTLTGNVDMSGGSSRLVLVNPTFGSGSVVNLTGFNSVLGVNSTATVNNVTFNVGGGVIFSIEAPLTLGANAVINAVGGGTQIQGPFFGGPGPGNLVNNGTLESVASGTSLGLGNSGTLVNNSAIVASGSGQVVISSGGTFTNNGTITANGGTVRLNRNMTTAQLGTFSSSNSGAVALGATLDNSVGTLALTATTGSLTIDGGTLSGGTVTATGGAKLVITTNGSNTITNATIGSPIDMSTGSARLTITGTTSFTGAGATVNLSAFNSTLFTNLSQPLDAVTFNIGSAYLTPVNGNTLTLGPGAIVDQSLGGSGGLGLATSSNGNVINNGIVRATVNGTLNINPGGTFTNNNAITATGTGTVVINPSGTATSSGTITADNGTVTIASGGTFTNNGTLSAINNGTININRNMTTAQLGSFAAAGGNLNLAATLDNTGNTLALSATTGAIRLNVGTISGGTVTGSGTGKITVVIGQSLDNVLNNVAVSAPIDLNLASARLTIAGTTTLTGAAATLTLGQFNTNLLFNTAQSFDGVTVNLGGGVSVSPIQGSTLTLGATSAIDLSIGGFSHVGVSTLAIGTGDLVNNGILRSSADGSVLTIDPRNLTNNGTIKAVGNSTVKITPSGTFTNSGTISADGAIQIVPAAFTNAGTLMVAGPFSVGGGTGVVTNVGTVTVNNTLSAGVVNNAGGILNGTGTVSQAVTINSGSFLRPGNSPGIITIGGGLTLNGEYDWDLNGNDNTLAGGTFDKVNDGALTTLVASANVNAQFGPGLDFTNPFWSSTHVWPILTATGGFASTQLPQLTVSDHSYLVPYPTGSFSLALDLVDSPAALDMVWNPTSVPEPGSLWLTALAAAALARSRRKIRRFCVI